jgi:hypothetical protein
MNLQHLWVLIPSLPLEYWCKEISASIGSQVGRFIALEDNFWGLKIKKWLGFLLKWTSGRVYQPEIEIIIKGI